MKLFRDNTPTKPGAYLVRPEPNQRVSLIDVVESDGVLFAMIATGWFYLTVMEPRPLAEFSENAVWSEPLDVVTELAAEARVRLGKTPA